MKLTQKYSVTNRGMTYESDVQHHCALMPYQGPIASVVKKSGPAIVIPALNNQTIPSTIANTQLGTLSCKNTTMNVWMAIANTHRAVETLPNCLRAA